LATRRIVIDASPHHNTAVNDTEGDDAVVSLSVVVSLSGVSVSYGSNRVLTDIDLSFSAGRISALLGANGAGKSTLIRALSGANPRYRGAIAISGKTVTLSSPTVARHRGISAVHQKIADGIVPGLTVAENVLLDDLAGGRRSPLRRRGRDLAAARSALALLGLDWSDRVLNQDARDLRISDAQLLILARALRSTPKLLILDEPTSALTAAEVDRLFTVLQRLRAGGLAIIYVSHRFGEVEALADSVVVLRDGTVQSVSERPFAWDEILHDMLGRATDLSQVRESTARGTTEVARIDGLALFPASEPVSLEIRGGEVLGVLGLIGAGKTELAEALAGAARPLSGSMTLGGEPYAPRRPGDAIRAGVVLVPEDRQQQGILPGWSVARNVSVPFLRESSVLGNLLGRRENARATAVVEALDVVTQSLDTSIDDLSGGNQQKVVVGRWLSASPRLALLDEPFRGVDIAARRVIGARLSTLAATGAAAVVFSSDVDEILEVSDRIVVLVSGVVALDSYADEINRTSLIAAFLGAARTATDSIPSTETRTA
jgi:simple sugar transport system ATP-binding protein